MKIILNDKNTFYKYLKNIYNFKVEEIVFYYTEITSNVFNTIYYVHNFKNINNSN